MTISQAVTNTEMEGRMDGIDIDIAVERKINRLDKLFMNSDMSQAEYDREMAEIDTWAERQYKGLGETQGLQA